MISSKDFVKYLDIEADKRMTMQETLAKWEDRRKR